MCWCVCVVRDLCRVEGVEEGDLMCWCVTEICAVSKVSKKEIGRVFKLILKTLETSVELITTGDFMVSGQLSCLT